MDWLDCIKLDLRMSDHGQKKREKFMLNPNETDVAQHYNHNGFLSDLFGSKGVQSGWSLLLIFQSVDSRAIKGCGYYRSWSAVLCKLLAQRGCLLYLIDISAETVRHNLCRLKSSRNLEQQDFSVSSFCNSGREG